MLGYLYRGIGPGASVSHGQGRAASREKRGTGEEKELDPMSGFDYRVAQIQEQIQPSAKGGNASKRRWSNLGEEAKGMQGHQRQIVAGVVMGLGVVLALSGAMAQQKAMSLTWTAGPVGGGWYQMAGGITELIRDTTG